MRNHYKIILLNSILTHNSAYIIISVLQLTITTDISNFPFLPCAAQDEGHDYSISDYLGLRCKTDASPTHTSWIQSSDFAYKQEERGLKTYGQDIKRPWHRPPPHLAASAQDSSWSARPWGDELSFRAWPSFSRGQEQDDIL